MKPLSILLLIFLLGLPVSIVTAQDNTPQPETVSLTAPDGLPLIGDFYAGEDATSAVLLLHMLGGRRQDWDRLVTPLTETGIAVLAVDMRGHGETGGEDDWTLAESDVQLWLDWLKSQPGIEQIALVGGSIGSNLALRGTANDPDVVTAVALSPGLDYRGVTTEEAITTLEAPVLLVAARRDAYSAESVVSLLNASSGEVQVRLYTNSFHGTQFLFQQTVVDMVVDWLTEQFISAAAS